MRPAKRRRRLVGTASVAGTLLLALASGGCDRRAREAPPEKEPEPEPGGRCDMTPIELPCEFETLTAEKSAGDGGARYRVTFRYSDLAGGEQTSSLVVAAAPADREALEDFYRGRHLCPGTRVHPPCAPSEDVGPPPPPVGTVVRPSD
jgi:hypothetical protein